MNLAELSDNWVVRSIIASMVTVLVSVGVGNFVGFFAKIDKIDAIATAQTAQGKQIEGMKETADKRRDDSTEVRVSLKGIEQEHRFLIDEVRLLRSELAAERKGR